MPDEKCLKPERDGTLREHSGENFDLRQSPIEPGEEARLVFAREFVFPNPQHAPAAGADGAGHEAVAGAVGGNLFAPEGGVGFRLRGVERATVPETAVDENGEAVRAENEVRFHAEFLQRQAFNFALKRSSSPPAGDAVGTHDRDQTELRVAIAA